MTAIVTSNLRLKTTSNLYSTLTSNSNYLYLFVSKPTSWVDESNPDIPTDSYSFERVAREEMIFMRKVSATEVSRAIFRIDWVSGKYYDMYKDDYDGIQTNGVNIDSGSAVAKDGLINANFYVVTDEYNVYKCIDNGGNAASTVKPTDTSTSIFQTADGYRWKFMYSISASDALRFSTSDFIPVKEITSNPGATSPYYDQYLVQQSAIAGAIDVVKITSAGAGYAASTTLPLSCVGDGTGFAGTATTNSAGQITSVTITNQGANYTYATITVTGTNTTPAVLKAIIPPSGGHGSNPITELYSIYVTISASVGDDLSEDTPKDNQYRILGLVLNPFVYGSSLNLTSQTANALKAVQISGGVSGSFLDDENLISTGTPTNRGKFVSWNDSTKTLKYIRNKQNVGADFSVSNVITGQTSSVTGTVSSIINPEVNAFSGEVLYLETRKPIYRSLTQKEEIRITIES